LGRKKTLKKYPINQTIEKWSVYFPADVILRLEIRNEEPRPSLYYSLNVGGKRIYEVEDHLREFSGDYPLYLGDHEEFTLRIREDT
jgi:hypothetical protein